MLRMRNITKRMDGNLILNDLNLEIERGMFGLLGPNGAGKTTLMRILSTIMQPTSGEISLGELNWTNKHVVRSKIGYLPQKFSMYKNIKVYEALGHLAILKGLPKTDIKPEVKRILTRVNLDQQSDKKIGKLSGGMIRRLGIAQALLGNPELIIVDEPTAGLDPEERIRFRGLLKSLSHSSTVLISTHIVEDIETTCDRMGILINGTIAASGTASEIANAAQGKVWELIIDPNDFYRLSERYNVISSRKMDDKIAARILSDKTIEHAQRIPPSLEEGYLSIIGNKSDAPNV